MAPGSSGRAATPITRSPCVSALLLAPARTRAWTAPMSSVAGWSTSCARTRRMAIPSTSEPSTAKIAIVGWQVERISSRPSAESASTQSHPKLSATLRRAHKDFGSLSAISMRSLSFIHECVAGVMVLGTLHRELGIHEQRVGTCPVAWVNRDADIGTHAKAQVADFRRS